MPVVIYNINVFVNARTNIQNIKTKVIQNYTFSSVLYGCETWSLMLREEHMLGAFEKRVLRKVLWPEKDEVTGECKRLLNKEVYEVCSSPNIILVIKLIRIRWSGHVARMGDR